MSSSFEKQQKRQTIAGYKRSSNFCSTPVISEAKKLSSLSLSAIDSNSSSAREQNRREMLLGDLARKQRRKKKLQQKPKKKSKRIKREIKTNHDDEKLDTGTDTDWETCDEGSRRQLLAREASTSSSASGSRTPDAVFRNTNVGSPEKVRRTSQFVENRLDSPLLRSRAYQIESPEKVDFHFVEDDGKTLPLKDLPSSRISLDDSDDNKSRHIKPENAVKNYVRDKDERNDRNQSTTKLTRIEKCKEWLVDVSIPTASSDYLWDDFIRNNQKDIGKYLAPAGNEQKSPSKKRTSSEDEEGEHSTIQSIYDPNESFHFEKVEQAKLRREMGIVRGCWNKSLQKWVRFYDVYEFPAAEDKFKRRITLNQFLQKCRDKRKRLEEAESKCSQNEIKENIDGSGKKNFSSNNRRERRRKHVEDPQFEPKKSRGTMTDISDSELQRINRVRQFASRLNARRKMMLDTTLASTSRNTESNRGISALKRINENDTDDDDDQRVMKPRSKPTIKSIQILTKGTFIRHKR